ncbi:long-chain fatty acid--CoA ligase [Actinomycetospora sp.]|jgi:long-chain acyl-CoA synthetase|uniref:long-chain-fatty-acid--CoA ligase n=1 Tax=Actinomycetospora sp. TaxID=1872135 RepID=UPI002F414217
MNLADILATTAATFPDRPALRLGDQATSYRELDTAVRASAAWLRARDVAPGERIALIAPNVPGFAVLFHGALAAGAVVVPMNPLLTEREITHYLDDAEVALVLVVDSVPDGGAAAHAASASSGVDVVTVSATGLPEDELAALTPLDGAVERDGEDLAVLLYTSGTTGAPKGAELTHGNLATNATTVAETLLDLGPDDVVMGCLPLFHVFGLTCGLNASLFTGACLALLPRFGPSRALELVAEHRVTVFEGVPTMYSALLHHGDADGYDTTSLRACVSGGSAMPVEVLTGFEEKFDAKVLEGYGLSETSPVVSFNHPDRPSRPGSIGTPIRGVEVRVLDDTGEQVRDGEVGEVAVRGEGLMRGYWRRPEATAEAVPDGWFRTGDLARRDTDGYLWIVDRKKQLIIRGGYNVYPREVEEALYEHPAVAEAAVIGVPHPALGEEVAAAIALAPDAEATPEELREFVKQRVAAYKYPRHVWLVEALPKGPTGKILHREVEVPSDLGQG